MLNSDNKSFSYSSLSITVRYVDGLDVKEEVFSANWETTDLHEDQHPLRYAYGKDMFTILETIKEPSRTIGKIHNFSTRSVIKISIEAFYPD